MTQLRHSAQAYAGKPTYLSPTAAADYLDVTDRTVRRYIAEGTLPAYRLGPRQIRLKLVDLDALMRPIPTAGGGGDGDAAA